MTQTPSAWRFALDGSATYSRKATVSRTKLSYAAAGSSPGTPGSSTRWSACSASPPAALTSRPRCRPCSSAEHVRHRGARQHDVVDAGGARRVDVERCAGTCRCSPCRGCARSATGRAARCRTSARVLGTHRRLPSCRTARSPVNIRLSTSCSSVSCKIRGRAGCSARTSRSGSPGSSSRNFARRAAATPCSLVVVRLLERSRLLLRRQAAGSPSRSDDERNAGPFSPRHPRRHGLGLLDARIERHRPRRTRSTGS